MQTVEDTPAESPRPRDGPGPELELVVAVAANGVIGRNNALPWHLPADLRHFRRLTTGHAMVMGRKTWASIGRPLPERQSIVITRDRDFAAIGATVVHSLDDALRASTLPGPVYCIGGAAIFRDALPRARRLHMTELAESFAGDVFLPAYDRTEWQETWRETHPAGTDAPFAFAFVTYDRVPR